MSDSFFRVYGIGNLTRDPELRYTPNGTPVCNFGMAANRRYKQNGEEKQETCFVDCTAWSKTAEVVSQYLRKGSRVHIEGRLTFRAWETEGQRRSKLEVTVDRISFLDRAPGAEGGPSDLDDDGPQ